LLQFKSNARLLRVHDKPGTGKSTLLRRLEYYCKYESDKPVSYVPLQDFSEKTDFELVRRIREDLQQLGFSEFDRLSDAYKKEDPLPFMSITAAAGKVALEGAAISGGTQAGLVSTVNQPANQYIQNYVSGSAWHAGLARFAAEQCIKEFFRELGEACAVQEVVLLLDSWDNKRTRQERRDWLTLRLIRPFCLDADLRPARLIAVVAGQDVPDYKTLWAGKFSDSVRESPFEVWGQDHVRAFLVVQGFHNVTPADIEYIRKVMEDGESLQDAIDMIVAIQQVRKRKAG
jgi:hypothetical protein